MKFKKAGAIAGKECFLLIGKDPNNKYLDLTGFYVDAKAKYETWQDAEFYINLTPSAEIKSYLCGNPLDEEFNRYPKNIDLGPNKIIPIIIPWIKSFPSSRLK